MVPIRGLLYALQCSALQSRLFLGIIAEIGAMPPAGGARKDGASGPAGFLRIARSAIIQPETAKANTRIPAASTSDRPNRLIPFMTDAEFNGEQ